MSMGAHGGQKRALNSPKLVLEGVVNPQMWVLGTKLRPSARAAVLETTEPSSQVTFPYLKGYNY